MNLTLMISLCLLMTTKVVSSTWLMCLLNLASIHVLFIVDILTLSASYAATVLLQNIKVQIDSLVCVVESESCRGVRF